ncbi:MAG: hypothetical protein IJ829_08545, partial [Kiritimatiellae bacterium]|nr:hypothetical protein [Kiritimatiellia bacterium]
MKSFAVLAAALVAASVEGGALYECRGPVAEQSTGWRFQASAAGGGIAYNPLEGWYPDKGGKLVSPRIPVPRTNAHYRLSFTAFAPRRAYEAVAFYEQNDPRGEYVLIVQGASEQDEPGTSLADAVALARRLEQAGLRKKEAARQAAEQ